MRPGVLLACAGIDAAWASGWARMVMARGAGSARRDAGIRTGMAGRLSPAWGRAFCGRCARSRVRAGGGARWCCGPPAAGSRRGGERGPAALPGCPWQRRTVTGERSSPAVSWLWCSCAAGAVKNLHVHRHVHISGRGWRGIPRYPLVTAGSRNPGMRQVARLKHSREPTTDSRQMRMGARAHRPEAAAKAG